MIEDGAALPPAAGSTPHRAGHKLRRVRETHPPDRRRLCGRLPRARLGELHPSARAVAITPWNPPPGLSLALLLTRGLALAPAVFVAGFAAEVVVRGLPAGALAAAGSSAVIAAGYASAAWALLNRARIDPQLASVRDVAWFVGVSGAATIAVSAGYVAVYFAAGRIPADAFVRSAIQLWVGDALGILITAPVLLAVLHPRRAAAAFRWSWEMTAQGAAVAAALWIVFGIDPAYAARFFYVLFLPLIWVSVRHGIRGATWTLLAIQLGIVAAVQIEGLPSATLLELQVFMVALAITGLFLGAVVTERRRAGEALEAREAELAAEPPPRRQRAETRLRARARAQPAAVGDRDVRARVRDPRRAAGGEPDAAGRDDEHRDDGSGARGRRRAAAARLLPQRLVAARAGAAVARLLASAAERAAPARSSGTGSRSRSSASRRCRASSSTGCRSRPSSTIC